MKESNLNFCEQTFLFQAQHALNNCVLGNTTILAEMASENDVQGLLHSLNLAQQSNSGRYYLIFDLTLCQSPYQSITHLIFQDSHPPPPPTGVEMETEAATIIPGVSVITPPCGPTTHGVLPDWTLQIVPHPPR